MQPFDVHTDVPAEADPTVELQENVPWMPFMTDLVMHYQVMSTNWWVVGVTGYNTAEETLTYAGNYLDYSNVIGFSVDTLQQGICGWYFAYDKATNYNAGFAPIICDFD